MSVLDVAPFVPLWMHDSTSRLCNAGQPVFGIAKPCRHVLGPELQKEWMGHLCGLCLALRDGHGHASRVTTNVDAAVLSILVDAQRDGALERSRAAPCPLRGMRTANVIAAAEPAAQHAVAVSLTMAATSSMTTRSTATGYRARCRRCPAA
ncbi:MAG: hypothetical protein HYX32_00750 [Actinobacteria bacterium]|nr:hypothetical protein [Actinomycetota bacterium]